MDSKNLSHKEKAEIIRKKHRYRELILSGRLVLRHEKAAQLVGPDCLYHLYSVEKTAKKSANGKPRQQPK
jgi:hypothetical protein